MGQRAEAVYYPTQSGISQDLDTQLIKMHLGLFFRTLGFLVASRYHHTKAFGKPKAG